MVPRRFLWREIYQTKINILLSLVATTISTAGATLNTERIDQLIGLKGKLDEKEGAYKISFRCDDIAVSVDGWEIPAFMGLTTWASFTRATHTFGRPARVHGVNLDNTMGLNTWAAIAGSDENAVVDGDFAVTENELRPALKSLREADQHRRHPLPYDRRRTADYFLPLLGPWTSSKACREYSESLAFWNCDTGETLPECKIRASASVTRQRR